MVQQSKKEYLAAIWGRYRRVGKKAKGRILDEFTEVCGYSRKPTRYGDIDVVSHLKPLINQWLQI